MTKIFHWFSMWKINPMLGCDIRLVFTLPPSTLQYKRCLHVWNNFPCIITLVIWILNQTPFCPTPVISTEHKFRLRFLTLNKFEFWRVMLWVGHVPISLENIGTLKVTWTVKLPWWMIYFSIRKFSVCFCSKWYIVH